MVSKSDDYHELLDKQDIAPIELQYLFENANMNFEGDGTSKSLLKLSELGSPERIAENLRTHLREGIDETNQKNINHIKKLHGTNEIILREPNTLFYFIMESLEDQMLQILLLASVASLIIGVYEEGWETGWIEGTAIFFAVFIVVAINSYNNWTKEQQFHKLSIENEKKKVKVRRNNLEKEIMAEELLVGDLLKVVIGEILNVDGIMVEGEIEVDESSFNGESDLKRKRPINSQNDKKASPFVVSGSAVKSGSGYILVCCVGKNSSIGKSNELMENEDQGQTPLQLKLGVLADHISVFGYLSAGIICSAIILREFVIRLYYGRAILDQSLIDTFLNSIITGVTVIVVAIPEGLPMAVSISLAYSVFQMKELNNLVRKIEASETMGGVDNICSDKTGTLTEGNMKVTSIFLDQIEIQPKNFFEIISKKRENEMVSKFSADLFLRSLVNNQDAYCEKTEKGFVVTGNMTDSAILNFLVDFVPNREDYLETTKEAKKTLPFSSEYKMMATLGSTKENDETKYRFYVKGAPEIFLQNGRISKILTSQGISEFNDMHKNDLLSIQSKYADECYRTIIVLYKDLTIEEVESLTSSDWEVWDPLLNDLTSIGMIAIADPERPTVKESIRILTEESKITVRMVTGDNIKTALAISKRIGIITEDEYKVAKSSLQFTEELKAKLMVAKTELIKLNLELKSNKDFAEFRGNKEKAEALDNDIKNLEIQLRQENLREPIALEGADFKLLSGGMQEKLDEPDKKTLKSASSAEEADEQPKEKKITKCLKDPQSFKNLVRNLKVISRASPEDKYLLVLGLKEIGHVVAVTGDGTNDAPALCCADVGFSMGIRGTDIAKNASSIVLLNDSFDSIVVAVKFGRNVFDCIRKFLQFQLTTNVVAVFMTLLGAIVLKDSPLNAIQMLWVNLIMDTFGSLALATEKPNDDMLKRKPYSRTESIITQSMIQNVAVQAIFQIIVLTIIIFYGDIIFGVASDRHLTHFEWNEVNGYHFTLFFNIFVFLQVFNSINARKLSLEEKNVFEGITQNYLYILIQLIIVLSQILMVTFGGVAIRTQRLTLGQHLVCILIASFSLVVGFVSKSLIPKEENIEKHMKRVSERKTTVKFARSRSSIVNELRIRKQ